MKKLIRWIFSMAILGSLATAPLYADGLMRKAVDKSSARQSSVAAKSKSQATDGKSRTLRGSDRIRNKTPRGMRTPRGFAAAPRSLAPMNAISMAGANGPEIYGTIAFSPDLNSGLYRIPTNSSEDFEMKISMLAIDANYGGAAKDGVYYLNNYYNFMGYLTYYESYGYDLETGEEVYYADISDNLTIMCPGGMALDPTTNEIFGISYAPDLQSQQLAKMNYSQETPSKTVIADLADWYVAFAIDNTGQFYAIREGIGGQGILCKLDRQTGASTIVGNTGQYPYYSTGAAIDAQTNRMYWTVSPQDETGFLTEVDLNTGVASVIYRFPGNEEVNGLWIPLPDAENDAPGICTDVAANFSGESLSGNISFTAPATAYNGGALSSNVTVTLMVDGEVYATKTNVAPGTSDSFPVTVSTPGAYTFTVVASNSVGDGPRASLTSVWIGADSPAATTATAQYVNGNMQITWLPVTAGINGGYIDPSSITYTVKDSSGKVLAERLTTTSYSFEMELPSSITNYYYEVYTVSGDMVSPPARTNTVVLGSIVPPYHPNFVAEGLNGWTIIDANKDGATWELQPDGSVMATYNVFNDMDDWLISPPISLEAGKGYTFAFEARTYSDFWDERFEVKWGNNNTVEAMTKTIVPPTEIASEAFIPYSQMIFPEEDGIYYFGFHGISDVNQFELYINNIQIEVGVASAAPGLATNLKASPSQNGNAWNCTVAFNAPTTTTDGSALSSLTKVELYRGSTLINTFNSPAVGAALSFTDTDPAMGETTYTVIGYNEAGKGLEATVDTFIGFDKPLAPAGVKISRTAAEGEVLLTWSPVTEDIHGMPLPTNEVSYTVCAYDDAWVPLAENLTSTSYTWQAVAASKQEFVQMAVFAKTDNGLGEGGVSEMIPVGKPYAGMDETFARGTMGYIWGYNQIGLAELTVNTDDTYTELSSATGDGGYLEIKAPYDDCGAEVFSGLISLEQIENPGLTFYTYNISNGVDADINEIGVAVRESDSEEWTVIMQPTTVDDLCNGEVNEWGKVTIPLNRYSNKTIQIQFVAVTKFYINTFIDDITVGSLLNHDLAAKSIYAPAKAKAGEDFTIDVTVLNDGTDAASGYSVELYADNSLLATEKGANLKSGESTKISFDVAMPAIAVDPISYYAVINYTLDQNSTNNQTASVAVTPVISNLPAATDLTAKSGSAGIHLSWNAPNLEGGVPMEITDDFEDADGVAASYGDWKFYDGDSSPVGGFEGMDIPGITTGSTTGSFWVWDNDVIGGNATFDAHSGNHYLFALYRQDDGTADDWAISPELYGGAQTISFYAKSYSSDYPEKIEVYYSTGSQNTNDFTLVQGSRVYPVPDEWTEYSYDLPAGAKYFAIRSCATGAFMLMVDDVTYTPAGLVGDLEIAGYNVYRDGVRINDSLVTGTEYEDTDVVASTQYTYVVTVVYADKGESRVSNQVVITFTPESGIDDAALADVTVEATSRTIIIRNARGFEVSISDTAGALIYSGRGDDYMTIEVAGGIYLVKAGNIVRKVLVK